MIHIIMATYNGERHIGEQIDSIFANTYDNLDIRIFDDCSTDATADICATLSRKYAGRIVFARNAQRLGSTANFLTGLSQTASVCDGDYYMYSDQDDIWHTGKVAAQMRRMADMERKYGSDVPLLVFTDAIVCDEQMGLLRHSHLQALGVSPRRLTLQRLLLENVGTGCTMLFNARLAELLCKTTQTDHVIVHDWWTALVAASTGHISFLDTQTVYYRQHGANQIGSRTSMGRLRDALADVQASKQRLRDIIAQAWELMSIYAIDMDEQSLRIVQTFINLEQEGYIDSRRHMIRYGFHKSGLWRNVGLYLLFPAPPIISI